MKVKCVICDTVQDLNDNDPLAKKLRNRPIHTYMCDDCYERIEKRTHERWATGHFRPYRSPKSDEEW
ncbi:YlaI family protein [Salibacterium aidingense]|uniref:YlaI family protein n=1 Tax=Salibacterium aidingense TaxID=384933 RepID=UPI003BDAA2D4